MLVTPSAFQRLTLSFGTKPNSSATFALLMIGLVLLVMPKPSLACSAAAGCMANMTESYAVAGSFYPASKAGLYIFSSEQDAFNDFYSEMQAYAADSDIVPPGANYTQVTTITGPTEVSYPNHRTVRYIFDLERVISPGPPYSDIFQRGKPSASTLKKAICETPPHTYPISLDSLTHTACWRCTESMRRAQGPQFDRYTPSGASMSGNNGNAVTWFSPNACPEEFFQNDPQRKTCEGNPIACESGAKLHTEVDYRGPEGDSLTFTRQYNSPQNKGENQPFAVPGWNFPDNLNFRILRDASYGRIVEIRQSLPPEFLQQVNETEFRPEGRNLVHLYIGGGNAETLNSSTAAHGTVKKIAGAWTWITADGETIVFGANGKPQRKDMREGRSIAYDWQELPGLGFVMASMTSETGRQLLFGYDSLGRMVSMTDPMGFITHYEYDSLGNLIAVIYPDDTPESDSDNPRKLYHYEDVRFPYHLTGITDENGDRFATYVYDEQGRGVLTTHANNANKTTIEYLAPGQTRVERHTDATRSRTLTYHLEKYHGGDRVTAIEHHACDDCSVGTEQRFYNTQGHLTRVLHPNGTETRYQPTFKGWTYQRIEAFGTQQQRTITTAWHAQWRVLNMLNDSGRITSYSYDSAGRLTHKYEPQGVTTYTYNSLGLRTRIDGPRTDVQDLTHFTYDAANNIASVTNARGHQTQYTDYDANGRLGKVIDANGVETQFEYTPRGWLRQVTTAGATTHFTYDMAGQLIEAESPTGAKIYYEYDAAHRLTAIQDAEGNRWEYTLDYRGNIVQETIKDAQGNPVRLQSRQFNALSQLISQINSANQPVAQYAYDVNGNLIEETTHTSTGPVTTEYQYDALNRLTQLVDALSGVTEMHYNPQDELTRVQDPAQLSTTYTLNNRGEMTQLASPDTGTTSYLYDAAGNRTRATDARGVITNYTYDALNRLTQVSYPASPAENVTYGYDSTANGNYGIGRLTSITANGNTTHYIYNPLGLVEQKTTVIQGVTSTTHYAYDLAGQLTQMTYPSGRFVSYARDPLGRVSQVATQANANATTQPLVSNLQYLPFGPAKHYTYGNGLTLNHSYDLDYRLQAIQVTGINPILDRAYAYDPANNITAIVNNLNSAKSQSFNYDALNRLTSAQGFYGQFGYTYDAVGNRLSQTHDDGAMLHEDSYTYANNSHRLLAIDRTTDNQPSGIREFTYDAAGNRIVGTADDGSEQAYNYNHANRMSGVSVDAAPAASYTYNPLGQRIIKTLPNSTKEIYHYDENGLLIAVTNESNATLREYVYLDGQAIAFITNGQIHYIHNDHLGTPQVATDQNQQVVWMGDYQPFGKVAANQSNSIELYSRFPGQYFDEETGLYYNYFRDYDPSIGRYIQSDPIGLDGGINTYAYVSSNPLKYIDPLGLYQMCHRDLLMPIPYGRHCYVKFEDGTTSSYDPTGVGPDPDPNQTGTTCTNPQDPKKDDCIKKAMQKCNGSDYNFTKFNCCHCVEQALKECGTSVPTSSWPNWPVNPGPQRGEPGYDPNPVYGPSLGK